MTITELPGLAASFSSASNEMLAAILDQSADCIKVISPDGAVDYMNRNGQCAMEVDDFCAIAGQQWVALWPADARPLLEQSLADAKAGRVARFEAFCPTAKASPRWWDVTVSPLRTDHGAIAGYIATSRDITDRVRSRDATDAVTAEMRHRLRNAYVVVGSLLSAFARGKPDRESFAREMIDRLFALGVAQTMKPEAGEICLLSALVPALVSPYATPDCPIEIGELPAVSLDQAHVDALALVLGELAVNSTKHGALSARGGIAITAKASDDGLELVWSERSDRDVSARSRTGGQGLKLMNRVLSARQGAIDYAWQDNGLDAIVQIVL